MPLHSGLMGQEPTGKFPRAAEDTSWSVGLKMSHYVVSPTDSTNTEIMTRTELKLVAEFMRASC